MTAARGVPPMRGEAAHGPHREAASAGGQPLAGQASHPLRKKKRSRLGSAVIVLFLLLCAGALFWLVAGVFGAMLRLETIAVEGVDAERAAAVEASCGLVPGNRLYAIKSDEVEAAVLRANPYLASVRVERRLPDTVAISCTERGAAYYVAVGGEFFALSTDLAVLEQGKTADSFAARGLVYVMLPEIRAALVGATLRFAGEADTSYLADLLETHAESKLYADTDLLRVDSRFDVRMVLRGSFALKLGDCSDMPLKLELSGRILGDKTFGGNSGAFLDLSDPDAASAILDKTTDYTVLWRD